MSTLAGQYIRLSYKDILQVSNSNSGIDATLRAVSDGEGTASILQLSSSAVNVNGTFQISGHTVSFSGSTYTFAATLTANTAVTFPTTGTLATLAGSEALTNKTITAAVLSGSFTGTYTLAGTPTLTSPTINSATLTAPILGTPLSGTLTNCTLPVGGVTGLGTSVATFLATPSSANLIAALTDETGTGAAVFANTPTLVSPVLGTPTSGKLSNCTSICAIANGASTSCLSGTTVVFGTEEVDSDNAYNNSTGIFTCPTAGKYLVTCSLFFVSASQGGGAVIILNAVQNSTTIQIDYRTWLTSATLIGSARGSTILSCAANDTIKITASNNFGGGSGTALDASGNTRLCIERIG